MARGLGLRDHVELLRFGEVVFVVTERDKEPSLNDGWSWQMDIELATISQGCVRACVCKRVYVFQFIL